MTVGGQLPQGASREPDAGFGYAPLIHRLRVGGSRGFTLIEMGLVLLIMSVVFALTVPRLFNTSRRELEAQARRLAVVIRHLRNEAILNGKTYRLMYDLDAHRYWVESADQADDFANFVRETGILAHGVALPEPISLTEVVAPYTAGKVSEGLAYTDFFPDGSVDLTLVHLDNGEEIYTLQVEPVSGRVYLAPYYYTLDISH